MTGARLPSVLRFCPAEIKTINPLCIGQQAATLLFTTQLSGWIEGNAYTISSKRVIRTPYQVKWVMHTPYQVRWVIQTPYQVRRVMNTPYQVRE